MKRPGQPRNANAPYVRRPRKRRRCGRGWSKAQEQFEHASGEQKAMYEKRLREMAEKAQGSRRSGKERARSMAEQTKKGYVYIISNIGSFGEDVYKIGLTRRWDPLDRVRELGGSSVPFGFDVHAMILSDDAPSWNSSFTSISDSGRSTRSITGRNSSGSR